MTINYADKDNGTITIVITGGSAEIDDIGSSYLLGTINFDVVGTSQASTDLALSNVSMSEGNSHEIDNVSTQDGTFTVN